MMRKLTQKEIIKNIENQKEELTAVEIILNNENLEECSIILNDKLFSMPYETTYDPYFINEIKDIIKGKEILLIQFIDNELSEAWKQSYLQGGIPEERHDRRVIPRKYNEMNELFCVDQNLLDDITDKWIGTPWEGVPDWKEGIIKWYKHHLI
ncbi:MAG: hypothetical protein IJH63_10495 [Methanobrevibacter sp.]|nr:hypothetical protein [Methanosphaera sp.]MBR0371129.1 hypothetical protein [Methanobrevibacter sp.]